MTLLFKICIYFYLRDNQYLKHVKYYLSILLFEVQLLFINYSFGTKLDEINKKLKFCTFENKQNLYCKNQLTNDVRSLCQIIRKIMHQILGLYHISYT